jgi:hypothetical protein
MIELNNLTNSQRKSLNFIVKYFWIVIIFIILLTIFYFHLAFKLTDKWQSENRKYKYLTQEPLYGVVTNMYEDRGLGFINFSDTLKICLPYAENLKYKPHLLANFLQYGDSIAKNKNSDTLLIFRKNQRFVFILGMQIKYGPVASY